MPDFADPTKLGSGNEMVQRLTNLIAIFENPALDFSKNRADGDDLLGDAYEYLMRHFATESGKSKGQFYTPAEVSRVIAQMVGIRDAKTTTNDMTVYDPTCGSGSLLLKVGGRSPRSRQRRESHTLRSGKRFSAPRGLARMNMILHDYPTADQAGQYARQPDFNEGDALKTFDYVVANPPFSDKGWMHRPRSEYDPWKRFEHDGVPHRKEWRLRFPAAHPQIAQAKRQRCVHSAPRRFVPRQCRSRDPKESRPARGYIKGIIGLPPNLFYGTGIPACIVVLDKEGANRRKGIFMIDARKGFIKDGNKNRLREQDIHKIVDTFKHQAEIPHYSRMVPVARSATRRTTTTSISPVISTAPNPKTSRTSTATCAAAYPDRDIDALDRYWEVIPGVRAHSSNTRDRPGYCQPEAPRRRREAGDLRPRRVHRVQPVGHEALR